MKTPYPHQNSAIESTFDYLKLPATGYRANQLGEIFYFTGKPCSKNHYSPRYASSGNCVKCIEEKRDVVFKNKRGKSSIRSKEDQEIAENEFNKGHKTYISKSLCPLGHNKRWITSNNCIECNNILQKKRSHSIKWTRIHKQYGISEKDVDDILFHQNHSCPICLDDISKKFHIDHCHSTNKVRGLLCSRCNQGIGLLRENENNFIRAISYLKKD